MDRRGFIVSAMGAAGLPVVAGFDRLAAQSDMARGILRPTEGAAGGRGWAPQDRFTLRRMPEVSGEGLTLTAAATTADIGSGSAEVWALNGSFPAPTIRLRRGSTARIDLVNQLSEPTILHWHGLSVPESADGHPRLAIPPGATYSYEFPVIDPAGTYWYHPHTHMRTAAQTYMGMAGLLIIEDEVEEALALPSAEFELPLILQDKRLEDSEPLSYEVTMGHDRMMGFLGEAAFGNGIHDPTVSVRRAVYRLRILNASNARIFDLGLTSGASLTLIGNDGGLLPEARPLERIMLSTGERADLLVDFTEHAPGDRIVLRSFAFDSPGGMMGMGRGRMGGMMGGMMGGPSQGSEMDLLEFVVDDSPAVPAPRLPTTLTQPSAPLAAEDAPRRTFRFESSMMSHSINGRPFEMERVDERIGLGQGEVWTFVNEAPYPHPVHVHQGRFRVLGRTGGRGTVMPWEEGMKDTVLVMPGESVDVFVRFADYPGLFLLHCHNLEHEDGGMMMNFEVTD